MVPDSSEQVFFGHCQAAAINAAVFDFYKQVALWIDLAQYVLRRSSLHKPDFKIIFVLQSTHDQKLTA